jgi:hypothetical protein
MLIHYGEQRNTAGPHIERLFPNGIFGTIPFTRVDDIVSNVSDAGGLKLGMYMPGRHIPILTPGLEIA